ncbi:MAG TPA: hypothetical protein VE890_12705 [Thermoguttaceae bacterium]|nr:hypothetical protein [Thermoguttaceae bacterium]
MIGKWTSLTSIFCLTLAVGLVGSARAALPLTSLLSFNRVDADPDKDYRITEENGPWMIMACPFSGDGAEQQARELVLELRQQYKLEAYIHQKSFNLGDARPRGLNRYGDPVKGRYRNGSELKEYAVMVGNYQSFDDSDAQKTLQKIKHSHPKCLEIGEDKQTNRSLAGWRMTQKQLQKIIGSDKQANGPMGHAFVTPNPVLPKDYFAAPGVDKLVVEMNKNVTHSLLNCEGKYTVQVATFKGNVFIEPEKIREIESGKQVESKLAKAARQAHLLTEALRLKDYDAYEFHDRYSSVVTVGSFNAPGIPRADGKLEIDPSIRKIIEVFGARPLSGPTPPGTLPTHVKTLTIDDESIPFDVQPMLIQVPKRSISRELAGGLF